MNKNFHSVIKYCSAICIFIVSQSIYAQPSGMSAYSGKPIVAGIPGKDCNNCHNATVPGAERIAPTVYITGPKNVAKGKQYSYRFTLSGGQKVDAGFDVSVDVGQLVETDPLSKMDSNEITHTGPRKVSADGNGTVSWTFDWIAPSSTGVATMYAAGLSGNGANGKSGDRGSTTQFKIEVLETLPDPIAPAAVISTVKTANINTSVNFSATNSVDSDGIIKSYNWKFSDGSSESNETVTHSFSSTGYYTVELTITDDTDLSDTTFVDIKIVDIANGGKLRPIAVITSASTATVNKAIDFDAGQSYVNNGGSSNTAINYIWDFGDGNFIKAPDNIAVKSHTYSSEGTYTVTLAAQDDTTLFTGVTSKTITIKADTGTGTNPGTKTPEQLYNDNCSSCHGAAGVGISGTAKKIKGASKLLIENAIAGIPVAIPDMSGIALNAGEAQIIADYLGTSVDQTGPELFIARCELCHGTAGAGATAKMIKGVTALQITNAISTTAATKVPLMAGIKLAATQAQSIEAYLVVNTPVETGKQLYDATCLTCHGPDGTGGSAKVIVNKTFADIKAAYANVNIPQMQAITVLTDPQIQLVADFLVRAIQGDPIAGEQTFIAKCQKCHGTGAGGYAKPILNVSEMMIVAAIDPASPTAVPVMSGIVLTAIEKQNLVALLAQGGIAKPTKPNDLYVMYCSNCHGADGLGLPNNGGKIRGVMPKVTAADITGAMNGAEPEMTASYLSKILTPADIKSIASTL